MHSERYHLQIEDLRHEDSTSYVLVERRKARLGFWSGWDPSSARRHEILGRDASEFFVAFLLERADSLEFLSRGSQQPTAEPGLVMKHESATAPATTFVKFVEALLAGQAVRAMDEVRNLRSTEPSSILLKDTYLYRLTYSLLYRWGLGEEALQLGKLNVELNPASSLAAQGLSMSYVDRKDYAAAIEVYRKLLETNPDDNSVKRTLEWLQSQLERSKNEN